MEPSFVENCCWRTFGFEDGILFISWFGKEENVSTRYKFLINRRCSTVLFQTALEKSINSWCVQLCQYWLLSDCGQFLKLERPDCATDNLYEHAQLGSYWYRYWYWCWIDIDILCDSLDYTTRSSKGRLHEKSSCSFGFCPNYLG